MERVQYINKEINIDLDRGEARIFQRGGHTAALPCVSAGLVVLSRHEGPY